MCSNRGAGAIGAIGLILMVTCGGGRSAAQPTPLPPTQTVIFPAGSSGLGTQLWASDGTPQGTRLLKQINPQGWAFPNAVPTAFTSWNGHYYFSAQDPEHGYELWRTDGTASGTTLVFDAIPGPEQGMFYSSLPTFVGSGGLYFKACTGYPFIAYLWRMDPDTGVITRLKDGGPEFWGGSAFGMANWGDETAFLGPYEPPAPEGSGLAFYSTNGSAAGTRRISRQDLLPYSGFSTQADQAIFVGYAQASNPENFGVWGCDLQTGVERLLIPMQGFVPPHWDQLVGPRFNNGFALVEVQEVRTPETFGLWRTDGTQEGTFRLTDLGGITGCMAQSQGFQGRTFFAADDGLHGAELWVTDGTVQGTRMLKDLVPGPSGSFPGVSMETVLPTGRFMEYKGRLYFGAGGPNFSDHVLWSTDGTSEGTTPVVGLPGTDAKTPKLPAAYCMIGDTLYFSAQTEGSAPYSRQLWRTNGTQDGTQCVTKFDFGQYWNPIWSIQPSPNP